MSYTIALPLAIIPYASCRDHRRHTLEEQVARIADKNKDGVLSKDEWLEVYKDLNLIYDGSSPQDLSNFHLMKYIQSHSK